MITLQRKFYKVFQQKSPKKRQKTYFFRIQKNAGTFKQQFRAFLTHKSSHFMEKSQRIFQRILTEIRHKTQHFPRLYIPAT